MSSELDKIIAFITNYKVKHLKQSNHYNLKNTNKLYFIVTFIVLFIKLLSQSNFIKYVMTKQNFLTLIKCL